MDITDETAIWAMLTSPMTVIDRGSDYSEKNQVYLQAEPSEEAAHVGVCTQKTQGVRVIKKLDNGWSLIECYSSSFHATAVEAWNMLVQGYVPTSWLKTVEPSQEMGIVIDKLTQKLYIFRDGKLWSTLTVSTGGVTEGKGYNETRSGEFITGSKVGEFASDNLKCSMAIRFNSGDLLHEVPHTLNADGSYNYKNCESKLGIRASHGCIRVQRLKNPEGANMRWLWDNIRPTSRVRVVIWEDWQGRQIEVPDDDFLVYYNPSGGEYYHSGAFCYCAPKRTFEPLDYGTLCATKTKLKNCPYCNPVLRKSEIAAINETHAAGGDHDPMMTGLRQGYIQSLIERGITVTGPLCEGD